MNSSSERRPPPTSSIVPTSTRTWLRMNDFASIRIASRSSRSCSHAHASTVRSNSTCSVCVGVNAVKSWVPTTAAAAASSSRGRPGSATTAPGDPRTGRGWGGEDPIAVDAGLGRASRVEIVRRGRDLQHGDVMREDGVEALRGPVGERALWTKLATWPSAWTPASVRPATVSSTRSPMIRSSADSTSRLDRPLPGLGRPAGEARAVVGDQQAGCRHRRSLDNAELSVAQHKVSERLRMRRWE